MLRGFGAIRRSQTEDAFSRPLTAPDCKLTAVDDSFARIVEFLEAYCTPKDTARRSPPRGRRSREPRRSPDATQWRHEARRQHDFESSRRPYDYGSGRHYREYDDDSARRPAFDAESARRRADYESARRTDFHLSTPGARRSPESAPEGSVDSPPEPAPSAPLRQDRQSCHRSQPYYESESSSGDRSTTTDDEEEFGEFDPFATAPSLHSPDSGRSDPRYANAPRRNPSPYYYGDLFKTAAPPPAPSAPTTASSRGSRYRKSASLDAPHVAPRPTLPKRFSVAEDGFRELDRSSSSSGEGAWMPPRRRGRDAAGCACAASEHVEERASRSVFYVPAPLPRWPQEMTARQIYETAFDCKVARSDDDLDDFDRVSNHPALLQAEERKVISSASSAFEAVERGEPDFKGRRKVTMKTDSVRRSKIPTIRQKKENENNASALSEELEKVHIEEEGRNSSISQLPLRGYTPSPPSTAPLPTKFQQKDGSAMNSIKSAPNLPQSQPAHPRLKDLRLPVKSLRGRDTPPSSDISMADVKGSGSTDLDIGQRLRDSSRESREGDDERAQSKDGIFLEIKGRPTSDSDTSKSNRYRGPKGVGPIMEFKGRPSVARPRRKYSSTESMATSSSGGSMESLRSSNSEGDRSTTSSESRHSSSLSSHSSDSGNVPFTKSLHHMQLSGFGHHPTKLHILSPISDKSSQEPGSETSDNNKNNNSQKVSPEDLETGNASLMTTDIAPKIKRRALQNKNLLNLSFRHSVAGDTEIQGSDSGISIHSREGVDSRNAFINFKNSSSVEEEKKNDDVDLSDLPFDMPKLRRRRAEAEVDLRTLPFDMPKLRRKLRGQSLQLNNDFGEAISNASSSQSVQDLNQGNKHRPKLTLNFDGSGESGGKGLHLNLGPIAPPRDLIDASLPLDRQGWYHGTLSRVEAEGLLRDANEGVFLVRNSESAKHDYSLSLKSTRGFMHMRICRGAEGYTLGGAATAFPSVPALLRHYVTAQRLPVRGAEHMALSTPLPAVLL
ncbi:SH2 domain-containing adapter protein B [Papilio xuthus]|uniref:SH2 domain-containing adapter protein B n=1 Tax=Papilio xuthus TaxID=66420 RepID=A0A194Q277_PAPXU|nr:SH2 domain-containing adapter protein B [Papilio xuthus]